MAPASPEHLALLLAELEEELVPVTSYWILLVLEGLELEIHSVLSSEAPSLVGAGESTEQRLQLELALTTLQGLRLQALQLPSDHDKILRLEAMASAAAELGDWHQAGLLWRQLLRPKS